MCADDDVIDNVCYISGAYGYSSDFNFTTLYSLDFSGAQLYCLDTEGDYCSIHIIMNGRD